MGVREGGHQQGRVNGLWHVPQELCHVMAHEDRPHACYFYFNEVCVADRELARVQCQARCGTTPQDGEHHPKKLVSEEKALVRIL
jgi:hypothetical protein